MPSFVKQAVAAERSGSRSGRTSRSGRADARPLDLPAELTRAMKKDPRLARAFRALTPGRQRGYVLHFTGTKGPETRAARIEKCTPRILAGKGMPDR